MSELGYLLLYMFLSDIDGVSDCFAFLLCDLLFVELSSGLVEFNVFLGFEFLDISQVSLYLVALICENIHLIKFFVVDLVDVVEVMQKRFTTVKSRLDENLVYL